jgi:hypothetical protein
LQVLTLCMCPPQVFGIEWCPYETSHGTQSQFATFGKKHMKLWVAAAGGSYTPTQLSFGKLPLQNVHSAAWLPPSRPQKQCNLVAGMADGQIYVFKVRSRSQRSDSPAPARAPLPASSVLRAGQCKESAPVGEQSLGTCMCHMQPCATQCMQHRVALNHAFMPTQGTAAAQAISAHKPGPKENIDGQMVHQGLRGLRVAKQGALLLSGGADGLVQLWDTSDGELKDGRMAGQPISIKAAGAGEKAPIIRCVRGPGGWHIQAGMWCWQGRWYFYVFCGG